MLFYFIKMFYVKHFNTPLLLFHVKHFCLKRGVFLEVHIYFSEITEKKSLYKIYKNVLF